MTISRTLSAGLLTLGLAALPAVPGLHAQTASAQTAGGGAAPEAAGSESGLPQRGGDREAGAAAAPEASGTCQTRRSKFKTQPETNDISTGSPNFVNVPGSGLSFTQGSGASSCVIVRFSAVVFAPEKRVMDLRVVLDGNRVFEPPIVLFTGDDDEDFDNRWARTHSFEFALPNVAPGSHQVSVQWRSFLGGRVFMNARTTVVQYR